MKIKLFEVRDKGTFIPVMAIKLGSEHEAERYLAARAGFGRDFHAQQDHVLVGRIGTQPMELRYDFRFQDRTYLTAFEYISENFDILEPGQVVDVEYILKEVDTPKESERLTE